MLVGADLACNQAGCFWQFLIRQNRDIPRPVTPRLEFIPEDFLDATLHANGPGLDNDRFDDARFGGRLRVGTPMAAMLLYGFPFAANRNAAHRSRATSAFRVHGGCEQDRLSINNPDAARAPAIDPRSAGRSGAAGSSRSSGRAAEQPADTLGGSAHAPPAVIDFGSQTACCTSAGGCVPETKKALQKETPKPPVEAPKTEPHGS